jgi:hypothetical protein
MQPVERAMMLFPASTPDTLVATGEERLVVVPSPKRPLKLLPQPYGTEAAMRGAAVQRSTARMCFVFMVQ